MSLIRVFALLAGSAVLAQNAFGATVQPKVGDVFIDRGSGYTKVSGGAEAKAGDTVMVMAGSTAEIIYSDGCRQAVDVGAVVVVGETSPCAALNPTTGGVDYTLVIGGVVVAGGVAAAIALSGGDSSASP
jgi:hypothetical protein